MTDVDLNFLARQVERLIAADAGRRDDERVTAAILMRIDNTVARLETRVFDVLAEILTEVRAVHDVSLG
jgi:hypothetical protein